MPQGLTLLLGTSFFHLDPSSAFSPSPTDLVGNDTYHHVVLTDDGAGHFTAYYRSPSDSFHSVFSGTYSGSAGGENTLLHIGGRQYSGIDSDARVDDVAIFNRVLNQAEAESIWAAGSVAAALTEPDPLVLKISRSGGSLDFEWNSMNGMQYDLVSSIDLSTSPATWPPYNDGVNTYEDIPASGTGTNTLSGVIPLGAVRFFALIEEPIPPLLEENFEAVTAPGPPTDWAFDDNSAGTAWSVGTPTGVGTEPDAAASGTQCAGTNIGGTYTASAEASLITKAFTVPATGATLSFRQYLDTETAPSGDLGSIRLLNAGDNSVLAGGEVAVGLEGATETWSSQSLALPAAANGLSVKLEFRFVSDADGDLWFGFYIDDVVVTPN